MLNNIIVIINILLFIITIMVGFYYLISLAQYKRCQNSYNVRMDEIISSFSCQYKKENSDFSQLASIVNSTENITETLKGFTSLTLDSVIIDYATPKRMKKMIFDGFEDKFYGRIKNSHIDESYMDLCCGTNGLESIVDEMRSIKSKLDTTNGGAGIKATFIKSFVHKTDLLKSFSSTINSSPDTYMFDGIEYGHANREFYNMLTSFKKEEVDAMTERIAELIDDVDIEAITRFEPYIFAACVWYYAITKPFSVKKFNKAVRNYRIVNKTRSTTEPFVAVLYSIKLMGGTEVLRSKVQEFLERKQKINILDEITRSSESVSLERALTNVASGLMWMQAYDCEHIVLKYMLEHQIQMTAKLQERLHFLSTGSGKAPKDYNISSNREKMYIDISAVSWDDDKTLSLIENLAFQEKALTYSIAVRDEDQELLLSQGRKLPDNNEICKKIDERCKKEYDNAVSVKTIECIALSGAAEEKTQGILLNVNEFSYMGVLVLCDSIGKKINIKFYTLFIPESHDLNEQKQQLLALQKKTGLKVTMWEKGIKDAVLMTIQQELNRMPDPDPEPLVTSILEF